MTSLAGLIPLPQHGLICASKHALESYSESLRHELLPLGVSVAIVEPGYFNTGIATRKLPHGRRASRTTTRTAGAWTRCSPVTRNAQRVLAPVVDLADAARRGTAQEPAPCDQAPTR